MLRERKKVADRMTWPCDAWADEAALTDQAEWRRDETSGGTSETPTGQGVICHLRMQCRLESQ